MADQEGDATKSAKDPKDQPDKGKKISARFTERLEEFLTLMDEENLQELEIVDGPFEVKLVRQSYHLVASGPHPAAIPASSQASTAPEEEPVKGTPIKSPLAGIFYRSPSPQAAPFIKEGDMVTPDKTLCIVEAMKVMNEIKAGVAGRVLKILVENGKPIQSGQTLFLIE